MSHPSLKAGLQFPYETSISPVDCGNHHLRITHIADMDKAIDDLFHHLEAQGIPEVLDELCPYFGMIWPAGKALASFLAQQDLNDKRFLEIGCGLALPSFVAAHAGARVTASDMHPDVPYFLAQNMALNQTHFHFEAWDWAKSALPSHTSFDVITGSDILYDRHFAATLSAFITSHLAPDGQAWIADPCRPYFKDFIEAMITQGFHSELVHEWRPIEEPQAIPVRIQRFWR